MDFNKDDLITIRDALKSYGERGGLVEYFEQEIEIVELADAAFDEDDGCAGGACKL